MQVFMTAAQKGMKGRGGRKGRDEARWESSRGDGKVGEAGCACPSARCVRRGRSVRAQFPKRRWPVPFVIPLAPPSRYPAHCACATTTPTKTCRRLGWRGRGDAEVTPHTLAPAGGGVTWGRVGSRRLWGECGLPGTPASVPADAIDCPVTASNPRGRHPPGSYLQVGRLWGGLPGRERRGEGAQRRAPLHGSAAGAGRERRGGEGGKRLPRLHPKSSFPAGTAQSPSPRQAAPRQMAPLGGDAPAPPPSEPPQRGAGTRGSSLMGGVRRCEGVPSRGPLSPLRSFCQQGQRGGRAPSPAARPRGQPPPPSTAGLRGYNYRMTNKCMNSLLCLRGGGRRDWRGFGRGAG